MKTVRRLSVCLMQVKERVRPGNASQRKRIIKGKEINPRICVEERRKVRKLSLAGYREE